jgi:hypothetical protein
MVARLGNADAGFMYRCYVHPRLKGQARAAEVAGTFGGIKKASNRSETLINLVELEGLEPSTSSTPKSKTPRQGVIFKAQRRAANTLLILSAPTARCSPPGPPGSSVAERRARDGSAGAARPLHRQVHPPDLRPRAGEDAGGGRPRRRAHPAGPLEQGPQRRPPQHRGGPALDPGLPHLWY